MNLYLTREEFGADLLACVCLFARRDVVRVQMQRAVGLELADLLKQEHALTEEIAQAIASISPADQRQLIKEYERA